MTMTDTNDTTTTTVKAPAKKRKPAKRRAAVAAPVTDGKFAGLSVKDCCSGCGEKACVISGKPYCAHPRKGGLHPAELQDAGAMQRRREAERVLGKQKLVVE